MITSYDTIFLGIPYFKPYKSCSFKYLDKINPAVKAVRDDLEATNFRQQSYGWALMLGGYGDCIADVVQNNRVWPQGIIFVI